MPVIGQVTTRELVFTDDKDEKITIPSTTYDVVSTFEQNGHRFYVTNKWHKEGRVPLLIVDDIVESTTVSEGLFFAPMFEAFEQANDQLYWIYSSNAGLKQAGTFEQYEAYVNSIFPDSKIKDVLWHGTDEEFEKYDASKTGANFQFSKGIHFDRDAGKAGYWGRRTMPAVINAQDVFVVEDAGDLEFARDRYRSGRMLGMRFDTVVSNFQTETGGQYVSVAEPEQVHFLGTPSDVNDFRQFVNR